MEVTYSACPIELLIPEAISFLQQHVPPEGYFLAFSGGKDSVVTYSLCVQAQVPFTAYYSCTTIDPPEVTTFIKKQYPTVKWLYSKENFYKSVIRKGPPTPTRRWCCDEYKKILTKDVPLPCRVTGVRAEESFRRASRPRIEAYPKYNYVSYKPIFNWSEWQIWDYIEKNKIPYCSLYDTGYTRIGCITCPFVLGPQKTTQIKRAASMKRYPRHWEKFKEACMIWYNRHNTGANARKYGNAENYWEAYLNLFHT